IRTEDALLVSQATQLTRGRVYRFQPQATDNLTPAGDIKYSIRVSTDGGVSYDAPFTRPTGLGGNRRDWFDVPVGEQDTAIGLRVTAQDKAGNQATYEV